MLQLGDGLPTGRLDRAQRLLGLFGLARHDPACGTGLHSHDADMVGDDVVQLASDTHSFIEHGPLGVPFPLPS